MDQLTPHQVKLYRQEPMAFFGDLLIPTPTGTRMLSQVWAPFQKEFFQAISESLLALAASQKGRWRGFWLERTKGASKDSDVGVCLLWLLAFCPRALKMEAGADDQDQILETREAMVETVYRNPWMDEQLTIRTTKIESKRTRSRLIFKTTDRREEGKGTHGSRPDVTVCNELSHVTAKGFIETMLDNADKIPTNLKIVATNAGNVRSWQWDWRERYREHPKWWFQKIDTPAPWIDKDALEDAESRNTRSRYLRLWHGLWTSGEGDALNEADVQWAKSRWRQPMVGDEKGYVFVSGIDLGVKHDHAALVTLGCRLGTGKVRLASCISWKPDPFTGEIDLTEVRKAIRLQFKQFNSIWIGYDPWQAALMVQDLKKWDEETKVKIPHDRLVEWNFSSRITRDTMARDILSAFRQRKLELYPDEELIDDIHRLKIVEKAYGLCALESVSDEAGHADRAVAMAICLPVALEVAQVEPVSVEETDNEFGNYDAVVT